MTTTNKVRVNFVRRTIPKRGLFSTDNYNSCMEELAVDLANFGARWNTEAYPILNTLPRGSSETRWVGATGVPDPFVYGMDGDNIFVDNDASTTLDDGLFWTTTYSRPKTIREAIRDEDDRITEIYNELTEDIAGVSNGLTADQWSRLGAWVKDGTASLATSVAYKARTGWDNLSTLTEDVFNSGSSLGTLQTSGFTLQEMVGDLLTLHGGTWNTDTSSISHGTITGVLQTGVAASASYSKRQRGLSPDANHLQDDMNRLRYEIARTKVGTSVTTSTGQWDQDVTDPVGSGVACLTAHIGYAGSGVQDSSNPHAVGRADVDGLDTEFGYNNTFTGKSALGSETPTYASVVYVTQSNPLETAIGELDAAIDTVNTALVASIATKAIREVYSFSSHTDYTTPITITHNKGIAGIANSTWPSIQVVDTGVGGDYGVLIDEVYTYEQEHGIVTGDAFVSIEYIDANTFHVYTNVLNGKIIAVF